MKAQLFTLAAAGLLLTAAHAFAADRDIDAYASRAEAAAGAKLQAAGVALPATPVKVRGTIMADGQITGLHVVASSGSRDADFAVETALKRLNAGAPPDGLIGAQLTLDLSPTALAMARAR